jgi:DNA adenine methylase
VSTSTPAMKIAALAPWYGSKRTLAPTIVEELGKHRAYWEPFCGSMAVLLAKPAARMETVNDLHGDLINLARCLADASTGPQLYRRLRRLLVSDETLREHDAVVRVGDYEGDGVDVDRALAFFTTSWMGRNGEVGLAKGERGRQLAVRWTPNGGDSATRFASAIESIPAWRRRMRGVMVLRRDAFTILENIRDEDGTVVYADPPYLLKSDEYLYDFADGFMGEPNDHERLAAALCRFRRARVVVSYYDHPALEKLYPGFTCRRVYLNKNMASVTTGNGKKTAPEVLLINGPSYAGGAA